VGRWNAREETDTSTLQFDDDAGCAHDTAVWRAGTDYRRYDRYFGVRTAKGDIGYVPVESLLLVKDKRGQTAGTKDDTACQGANYV